MLFPKQVVNLSAEIGVIARREGMKIVAPCLCHDPIDQCQTIFRCSLLGYSFGAK